MATCLKLGAIFFSIAAEKGMIPSRRGGDPVHDIGTRCRLTMVELAIRLTL
jgi:hypothetical protein